MINTLLFLKMESLIADSRIPKVAAPKHRTKSAHNSVTFIKMCEVLSSYKSEKKQSEDGFISKV